MQRIKTLCIILLIVFFGSIYQSAVLPFIDGINYGLSLSEYQIDNKTTTQDFVQIDLNPRENFFPDRPEINLKNGQTVMLKPNNVTVMAVSPAHLSFELRILQSIHSLLILITLILGIWIPFLVIKIIKSLQASIVFDNNNLLRIGKIGYFLLSIGILETILQSINVIMVREAVQLMHYDFSFSRVIDFSPLLMGLIILIMNEILRIGVKMKEENDLTI